MNKKQIAALALIGMTWCENYKIAIGLSYEDALAETIKEFGISVEQYQELCRIATK